MQPANQGPGQSVAMGRPAAAGAKQPEFPSAVAFASIKGLLKQTPVSAPVLQPMVAWCSGLAEIVCVHRRESKLKKHGRRDHCDKARKLHTMCVLRSFQRQRGSVLYDRIAHDLARPRLTLGCIGP